MEFGIRQVAVGGLERAELMQHLAQSGVQLNGFAKQLLEHQIFDGLVPAHDLTLTSRTCSNWVWTPELHCRRFLSMRSVSD